MGVFGALTPDCCPGWEAWAGGHWDENGACCSRSGGFWGVSKWTGNANMATVGKWKGSEVQAADSAGGRLSVRSGGGVCGLGGSRGKVGLHKHPVPLPRPLHHIAKCAARPQWANHTCFSLACLLRLAAPQQSHPHPPQHPPQYSTAAPSYHLINIRD